VTVDFSDFFDFRCQIYETL